MFLWHRFNTWYPLRGFNGWAPTLQALLYCNMVKYGFSLEALKSKNLCHCESKQHLTPLFLHNLTPLSQPLVFSCQCLHSAEKTSCCLLYESQTHHKRAHLAAACHVVIVFCFFSKDSLFHYFSFIIKSLFSQFMCSFSILCCNPSSQVITINI